MPNRLLSPLRRNIDLVTFAIKIDGSEIPAEVGILSLSVYKEVNRISTAKVVIQDGNPAEESFIQSSDSLFIPGKAIEISAGYHSDNELIFKGLIVKHSIKIRKDGRSTLSIECKDEAVKMTVGRKSKYFYESKDSDAIEELIGSHSLASDVDATEVVHQELVQYRTTDWDFMLARAEANGKICLVEDGTVKIASPDFNQSPLIGLTYGNDLLDFDAEIDARDQFSAVNSKAWDYTAQEVMDIEANENTSVNGGNLASSNLAEVIGLQQFEIQHGGKATEAELQAWADAQLLRSRMAKIRGRASFQGMSEALPGQLIELNGVGDRFNGNVFISAVRHQIVAGNWITDVQFGFNPEWFAETFEISQLPASGLFAAVSGLQIGLVTQLADDPDGDDRILVRLPLISAEEQGVWARVASLDAGNNRGAFFRPEIGDEVILGFINDDPGEAVVLGMLNSSAKPAPITATDDNHEKGFVTRSEMKLLFNDDEKSITVETPNGNKLILSEDSGSITIEDENGNSILMESSGITIESASDINIKASGDINLEGTNISAKANAQFTAEGSAGAELSTSAVAVVKGSLVQIN
jgi:Rhs element Vgr protein